eukprot:TRINITY_DN1481_c2_g1_i1.p1 TRINITY_DN1481_c2_g1~~TRINITY_DN1481_c2_g1_i1.p1  ORF type:complete len:305 (-),score=45.83 TRINITY_DN1481_c2_g1_i1:217-1131(-)
MNQLSQINMQALGAPEELAFEMAAEKLNKTARPSSLSMGYLAAFIGGLFGLGIGGYIGWMLGDGPVVVSTACAGFALIFGIIFCAAGPYQYHFGNPKSTWKDSDHARANTYGLSEFDLYVTVHRVKNVYNADSFFGLMSAVRMNFVEVRTGRLMEDDQVLNVQRNPPKKTCISEQGVFEECFHFVVSPTDDTIRFVLYGQDTFKDELVGICDINLTDEVLGAGFPQKRSFNMARPAADPNSKDPGELAGTLIVSFAPGKHLPHGAANAMEKRSGLALQHMRDVQSDLKTQSQSYGNYGTWATSA